MKKVEIEITENDVIKAIRNPIHSPIELAASRTLKKELYGIDVKQNAIYIWAYDDSDYLMYRYCKEDIENVKNFIDAWEDFKDNKTEDFVENIFTFCVEELR